MITIAKWELNEEMPSFSYSLAYIVGYVNILVSLFAFACKTSGISVRTLNKSSIISLKSHMTTQTYVHTHLCMNKRVNEVMVVINHLSSYNTIIS